MTNRMRFPVALPRCPQTLPAGWLRPARARAEVNALQGYTLFELLLVLAVISVVLAIAWPNVMRLSSQQKLIESAEKVRALAASARVHAIESGLIYQFRYEPGGSRFVAVPFEREFEGVNPTSKGTGTALGRFSKASGVLPEGVRFAAPALAGTQPTSGTVMSTGMGQKLPAQALAGLPDASKLESVGWSGPVQFLPDGSATDFSFELTDQLNQRVTLQIRGITGAITVSRVQQMVRL